MGYNQIRKFRFSHMNPTMKEVLLPFLIIYLSLITCGLCGNVSSSRPDVVNIGALLSLDSIIGRVANVAIKSAVDDINSDPNVLRGTKLVVQMQDTYCSGAYGVIQALQFMKTDFAAIIGPQSSVAGHVVSYVSNAIQVPLLSFAATDPTLSSKDYPFFVQTTPNDLFQMTVIAKLVDYYRWKQVVAIFVDDDYGRNGITSLSNKLADQRCKISYKATLPPDATIIEITDLLVNVAERESRVIILHVHTDIGTRILSQAHHLGMMADGFVWIATDWLSSLLDSSSPLPSSVMKTMQGVLTLRRHTADSKSKGNLVGNWSKLTTKFSRGKKFGINSYGLYAYDTIWMVAHAIDAFFNDGGAILSSERGKILLKNILNTDFVGVTGHLKFDSDGKLINPSYDIHNIVGTGFRMIGYWSNYSGLSVTSPESLYMNPGNLSSANEQLYSVIWPGETSKKPRGWVLPNKGKELRIGVPYRIFFQEFVAQDESTQSTKGYCIDVFTAAIKLLPYAVPYRFVPFGNGKDNPSYDELINLVASNVYDAAVGDITIITNRTKIVHFTQPYIESGLAILASVKNLDSNAWAFLKPFTLAMWCVTGLFFLVVGTVVWILEHRINDEFRGPPRKQLVTACWFSFSTLFFAQKENTVGTLGRGVVIIWLFVVLIIQSSYTASLTSILTVRQLSSPIKGIDGLIASDVPIGFQAGSFVENYLVSELGISRSRLRALNSREDYVQFLDLGPENGGVAAVVDERPYIELFLSSQCKYAIVGSDFTRSGWGFAFQQDSPIAVDLSTAVLQLSENGDLQRIHDQWLSSTSCSSESTDLGSDRVHVSSFWGLFVICGIACIFALIIFFFLILKKFIKQFPTKKLEDSGSDHGSSRGRVLQTFISFVDNKEEDVTNRTKGRQMLMMVPSRRADMER